MNRLKDWALHFVKHRDLFLKNLTDIEEYDDSFIANFKTKAERYIVRENLKIEDNLSKDESIVIVTLNNARNFQVLISEWKVLISFPKLKVIFVEKISNGKHWIIHPYMHDKISDKASLKQGLKALYDNAKND